MPQHRWKKGEVQNPRGRQRKIAAFAERLRETTDWDEVADVVKSILRGEPMVTVMDQATGLPRLADRSPRQSPSYVSQHAPGEERPKPLSKLQPGEQIFDIKIPTPGDRLAAATWIRDSAGQKPPSTVEMDVNHNDVTEVDVDFSKFTPEQLDQWIALNDLLEASAEEPDPALALLAAKDANPK